GESTIEGYSGATPLAIAADTTVGETGTAVLELFQNNWLSYSFESLFYGTIPGSIGETSTLMALIGAFILIGTGVGSWRIILSMFVGGLAMGYIFNIFGTNPFTQIPPYYHLVLGGFAFGAVFMATDPVSAAQTNTGKWIYGFLIGILAILIRVTNPAYPEGVMLSILLMNVFAPLIDFYVIEANKKRRLKRAKI
ncbi:MAG: RnfABCDGE type electron transport complex subunit D, partial [Bacteroidetes bacterium]|nr:RnfABCDGE type electron transport complex subunit D [Bacteroidota bacterium]